MEDRLYALMRAAEEDHWWFIGRRAVIEVLLERAGPPRPARVLDVGCGTGRNLELYSRLGEAEGVDPSERAVEFCRGRGLAGVRRAVATELPFEDGRFGMVAATDVVEHIADDRAALAEMCRVTARGGSLVLTVPAYRWLWSGEDVRLQHHRRYTLRGLRRVAAAAGWEPIWGTYFNTLLLPPIALVRTLRRRSHDDSPELELAPRVLNGALSLPMRLEARLLGAGLRLPAGVSIGLLCRRG